MSATPSELQAVALGESHAELITERQSLIQEIQVKVQDLVTLNPTPENIGLIRISERLAKVNDILDGVDSKVKRIMGTNNSRIRQGSVDRNRRVGGQRPRSQSTPPSTLVLPRRSSTSTSQINFPPPSLPGSSTQYHGQGSPTNAHPQPTNQFTSISAAPAPPSNLYWNDPMLSTQTNQYPPLMSMLPGDIGSHNEIFNRNINSNNMDSTVDQNEPSNSRPQVLDRRSASGSVTCQFCGEKYGCEHVK